jgi:hypothetical protein
MPGAPRSKTAASRSKTAASKSSRPATVAADASAVVLEAASVLETELASSLAGVRKLEARFSDEHRVDQKEFDELRERLRTSAHEFIDAAAGRMADLRSSEAQDLTQRLASDGHALFDTMINLLGLAPDIVNRLAVQAEEATSDPSKRTSPRAKPPVSRRRSPAQTSR